jgi:hypothetical protein
MSRTNSHRQSLNGVSASDLRKQMQAEIKQLKAAEGLTSSGLAEKISYSEPSIAKWASGAAAISLAGARAFDAAGYKPSVGDSFVHLVQRYKAAKARSGRANELLNREYDVYLASPMASTTNDRNYQIERKAALDVKRAIEIWCNLSVFYAGDELESRVHFRPPELAGDSNFRALGSARFFVLLIMTPIRHPSSIFIEAGYALARGIPALYIAPTLKDLPFVLRKLTEYSAREVLPPVSLQYHNKPDEAVSLIQHYGTQLFDRLTAFSSDAPLANKHN